MQTLTALPGKSAWPQKMHEVKPIPKPKPAGFNPDGSGSFPARKPDRFPQQWDDSFIGVDESRPAKLS